MEDMGLTWEESPEEGNWLADVTGKAELLDLAQIWGSFVRWLLDTGASWIDEPFLARLEPAVVENFHTSFKQQNI